MIGDKKKYLEHIQDKDQIITLRKILDNIEKVLRTHSIVSSDFLNPYQRELSYSILNRFNDISYHEEGGYDNAERKVIVLYPDYLKYTDLESTISAIEVQAKYKLANLGHKDFLGALMGLGVKREKIGDINVSDESTQIIISSELTDYIIFNLDTVGKESVDSKEISLQKVDNIEEEYNEIITTVSSLRLDAVISASFNISRSDSSNIIKSDKAKVNFKPIDNISYLVNEGDLISVRKKGRVKLKNILGESKKGRLRIQIFKYI